MSMDRPRISVEITEELQDRIKRLIPWGLQSTVMRNLITRALDVVEEYGELGLGAVISGRITIIDLLRKKREEEDEH